jgi:hypothetical protein
MLLEERTHPLTGRGLVLVVRGFIERVFRSRTGALGGLVHHVIPIDIVHVQSAKIIPERFSTQQNFAACGNNR